MPVKVIEESVPRTNRVDGHNRGEAADRQAGLALVLDNGLRLEIGSGFDSGALRRVLEVLAHVG